MTALTDRLQNFSSVIATIPRSPQNTCGQTTAKNCLVSTFWVTFPEKLTQPWADGGLTWAGKLGYFAATYDSAYDRERRLPG
jgi:hypothetical protein